MLHCGAPLRRSEALAYMSFAATIEDISHLIEL
jgi:hypothetical protein